MIPFKKLNLIDIGFNSSYFDFFTQKNEKCYREHQMIGFDDNVHILWWDMYFIGNFYDEQL